MKRARAPAALFAAALAGQASLAAPTGARAAEPGARAANAEDAKARAKSYFDAALQAYAAAQYIAAADAFLKAHQLLPSDSLIFSAAQAYRRQYYIDQSPANLRRAVQLYRDYLLNAEQGRRRQDASDALAELTRLSAPVGPRVDPRSGAPSDAPSAAEPPKPEPERPTQLLVTSRTPGALTSIDGGPPRAVPLVVRVAPGEHEVVVRAPGYFEDRAKTIAVLRETIPVNIPLRPMSVELNVRGEAGAKVFSDGVLLARLPLSAPLRLSGGEHLLSVLLPGRVGYSTPLYAASGSQVDLDVSLPRTAQRYAAVTTLGVGGASLVIAGVLAGLAGRAHEDARAIDAKRGAGEINGAERDAFNEALDRRDTMTKAAAAVGAVSATLGLVGVGLYLFDSPDVAAPGEGAAPRKSAPPGSPTPAPDAELYVDARGAWIQKRF